VKAFPALALAAALAGCGAAPLDYHSQNEIPRGPGMLSGVSDERAEFARWKKEKAGSAEYQEFLDWREWRRERQRLEK
jgi:hypothetical protein